MPLPQAASSFSLQRTLSDGRNVNSEKPSAAVGVPAPPSATPPSNPSLQHQMPRDDFVSERLREVMRFV